MMFLKLYEKKKKEKQRKLKIKNAKKILAGAAAGSLSGLLGGLLFSPKSGKENREQIVTSSKELTGNIKQKTTEMKETVDNKVIDVKDSAKDAKIKIKQKTADLKETIENKASDVKDSATDAKVKIGEYLNEKKSSKVVFEIKDIDNEDSSKTDDSAPIVGQTDIVDEKIKK
jgi:gas vesicle protein